MPSVATVGKIAAQTTCFHKALTEVELADKDAKGQRVSSLGVKAGERIRTADVQLGKLAFYH